MDSVAVTGIGIVSSIGISFDDFSEGIREGRRAGGPLTLFEDEEAPVVAEVADFNLEDYIDTVKSYIDRTSALALAACAMAREEANWELTSEEEERAGLALGTSWGCMDSLQLCEEKFVKSGPRFVPPLVFTHSYANSPNSIISIEYGLRGFNVCFSGGHACGLQALAYGADQVRLGRADYLLGGGADAMSAFVLKGYGVSGALADSSMPFDSASTGFLLSEGAAVFGIEPAEQAGERAYAILLGSAVGRSEDGVEGCLRSMKNALAEGGLGVEDLGLVVASASGDPEADSLEAMALDQLMNETGATIPVFPSKLLTGEAMAAGGGLGLAAAIVLLEDGELPSYPIAPDSARKSLNLGIEGEFPGEVALVNSVGSGGEISSIAVRLP